MFLKLFRKKKGEIPQSRDGSREWQPETLGQYHDMWSKILLCAPDQFYDVRDMSLVSDQRQALLDEFARLRSGFHFVGQKLKDERLLRIAQELMEMAFEAYLIGDKKLGAHTLQECEGIIWPSLHIKTKYAVEAERRAFGENVLYSNIVVSPYPYEGTSSDLGTEQTTLLALAEKWCRAYQMQQKEFKYFSWVIDADGGIRRTSLEPKEDDYPILPPVQRSFGFKRLQELGHSGQIRACVLVQIISPLGDGIVSFELEQRGRPRVSARQLFKRRGGRVDYENMRFHLEDPQFFADDPGTSG